MRKKVKLHWLVVPDNVDRLRGPGAENHQCSASAIKLTTILDPN